jgi:hypothetical protein
MIRYRSRIIDILKSPEFQTTSPQVAMQLNNLFEEYITGYSVNRLTFASKSPVSKIRLIANLIYWGNARIATYREAQFKRWLAFLYRLQVSVTRERNKKYRIITEESVGKEDYDRILSTVEAEIENSNPVFH